MKNKRVMVLGGDGFFGWPCSLYLSQMGYNVTIVDSLIRRRIDEELGCGSLTPIRSIWDRIDAWEELSGRRIKFKNLDISRNYAGFVNILANVNPDVVVHLAEIRSAPYSMKSDSHKRATVNDNVNATNNTLCALTEVAPSAHLIHIGTAGVYGYHSAGIKLPEGYVDVIIKQGGSDIEMNIPFPTNPGSVYHMTKCMDAEMFRFYSGLYGLKITDLHQGIIWGTQTDQTAMDERLINRFDYDGDYGTVLNRFLMQAALGHPLTVHGAGGQTRALIHLRNSVQCVLLAIKNPPADSVVRVINQATEVTSVNSLAEQVSELTGAEIAHCHNPTRVEAEGNKLDLCCDTLIKLGLEPITLEEGLMEEIYQIADKYKDNCDSRKIIAHSVWRKGMKTGLVSEI